MAEQNKASRYIRQFLTTLLILQAHCQSRTSQRYFLSFVKELTKPLHILRII